MAKKITNEDIEKRLYDRVNNEYKLVSDYKGGNKHVELLHTVCNNIYTVTPNHFFYDGNRCRCQINIKQPEDFSRRFKEVANNDYEQLTPYRRVHDKIEIKHVSCGHVFSMEPNSFMRGSRCPKCFGKHRKTTEMFKQEVNDLSKGEFELMSEYVNNRTKVKIKHIQCNHEYLVTPKDFLRGNRCPLCKQSKGERMVKNILESKNVIYEIEKCYDDLKVRGKFLPFDFYLPNHNLLIEYDGEQHFKEVKYFGGKKKLESQKRRDGLKNKYALDNNINLLRIPYTLTQNQVVALLSKYL